MSLDPLPGVFVFVDESEYEIAGKKALAGNRVRFIYAVGAVVVEGNSVLEGVLEKLAALRDETVHDRSIKNHPERERLQSLGWHLTEDQISTSAPLWQFIGQSPGIKFHYRYAEAAEKIAGSQLSRAYAVLHATLVRDLARRYKNNSVLEFAFEEYTGLNAKFAPLVNLFASQIDELTISPPRVKVVAKGELDLSSVADYMILGFSRLIAENHKLCAAPGGCGGDCEQDLFSRTSETLGHVDSSVFHFRNFENIRSSLSSAYKVRWHTGALSGP